MIPPPPPPPHFFVKGTIRSKDLTSGRQNEQPEWKTEKLRKWEKDQEF